jgi:3',5'-cyclic AMP phosphodiesterase CpdA
VSLLLQISDPHFGTEQAPVVEALLALATELQPDVYLLSGDITQRARRAQFDAARAFVDRLPPGIRLVIPGNHDIPLFNLGSRLLAPYHGFQQAFGDALEAELSTPDLLLIALNTTRWWRHKHGELDAAQVARVRARLRRSSAAQLRVVATHQPIAVPDPQETHNLLRGREPALPAWAEAGVDLLVGGHIHLPYVIELSDRLGLPRRLWCVQAGTALSHRVRAGIPNSVNLIRCNRQLQPLRCVVERWDFDAASGRFVRHTEQTLTLDRRQPAP